jgi:uracil-DNA glycosylase family 4
MSRSSERLEELADEIRAHRGCGFEPCETATNPVPGEGSPTAEVVFVGEAPGAQEDREGRPFVGSAGKLLDQLLASIELDRGDVFITNVLKARPPGNRDPKADEIFHSWPWLKEQLELIRPRVIVPLGRHALECFLPGAKVSQDHGRPVEQAGWTYVPMYHPAAAFRVRPLLETMFADFGALPAAIAGAPEPPTELVVEPLRSAG